MYRLMVVARSERPSRFKITCAGIVMVHRGVCRSGVGLVRCRAGLCASVEEHRYQDQCRREHSFRGFNRPEVCLLHGLSFARRLKIKIRSTWSLGPNLACRQCVLGRELILGRVLLLRCRTKWPRRLKSATVRIIGTASNISP
jgi:hypothetical protein